MTILVNTPTPPTLLLSPDGSRDRNGVVTPTVGSNVSVVAGQYGNAWNFDSLTDGNVATTVDDRLKAAQGTVLVRMNTSASPDYHQNVLEIAPAKADSESFKAAVTSANRPSFQWYHGLTSEVVAPNYVSFTPLDIPILLGMSWNGVDVSTHNSWESSPFRGVMTQPQYEFDPNSFIQISREGVGHLRGQVESVLIYDTALSDAEIERISNMPEAWTWENTHVLRPVEVESTIQKPISASYRTIPRLWKVTRNNEFIEDLTPLIVSGNVSFDPDRTIKWAFEAQISADANLKPYQDFIAPYLRVEYEDGHVEESQFGIYTSVPPKQTISQTQRTITLDSRDLTWILSNMVFADGYTRAGGNIVETIRLLLEGAGFNRHSIPDAPTTLAKATSWKAGTSRLQVINDMLNMCGMYSLFMDKRGYLASLPYVADKDKAPSVTYDTTTRNRVKVLRTIDRDTTPDRIANRIVVIGGASTDEPIIATKLNDSPNSPTSTVNLGMTISKVTNGAQVADQAAADAMAQRLLDTASQEYHRLTLHTSHDVSIDPYDVYRLNIIDAKGDVVADGVWNSRGWSMGFTNDEQMTHDMSNIDAPAMKMEG